MARTIDLLLDYKKLPAPNLSTAYGVSEIYAPIVKVALVNGPRSFETIGMLDSGAGCTIFGTNLADLLGIDWKSCPKIPIIGLGKADNEGYVAACRLILADAYYGWDAKIAFCPTANAVPYGLLGHLGFFENVEVRFKTRQRTVRIFLRT